MATSCADCSGKVKLLKSLTKSLQNLTSIAERLAVDEDPRTI